MSGHRRPPQAKPIEGEQVAQREDSDDSYAAAGVDIAAGAAFVDAIRPAAAATARPGAEAGLGGFGAVFDPRAAGYRDPLLVAATDGVGTKLKVASATGLHRGVGIDLVAMCANDVLAQGAEPLVFLDYFATGALDSAQGARIVEGIAEGCSAAGCALIGGETAEMPGMYAPGDYDLAGFVVGAMERGGQLTGGEIEAGDAVLGLASSGLHANGFSLVRKIVDEAGLDYAAPAPFEPAVSLGEALMRPTRIYVKSCLRLVQARRIKGLAHITGGGLLDNLPRVLPDGTVATIDAAAWPLPDLFDWLAETGALPPASLARTFNCGIGMAAIVPEKEVEETAAQLREAGETVWRIGRIEADAPGARRVVVDGAPGLWNARAGFALEGGTEA